MEHLSLGYFLPNEIENLIIEFCYYPCKKVTTLNSQATVAFINSRNMPTPNTWKNLLTNRNQFDWNNFLKTNRRPYDCKSLINLKEVQHTVRMLNWHTIKSKRTTCSKFAQFKTKRSILHLLSRWSPAAYTLVFLIQRLLCSLDFPGCLNRYDTLDFESCLIANPNPLCMYVEAPIEFL
jgi:hypothetical protein